MKLTERDEARFWSKVALPNGEGCMLWLAGKTRNGYGRFLQGGRMTVAHRVLYEWTYGPISEGLQVDHLCRVRACVNPAHLEPVTQQENIRRGMGASALNAAKTHCPQGHEYDEANTHIRRTGWRSCRSCNRERYHARRRKAA